MNPSTEFIPFSRPQMGPEEESAVLEVLRSGWLTTGPQAKAFEEEFARYVGSPHALAVNSATSGLHLALEALGVGPGDTVAVPTCTFTATAEVVRYLGAEVVLVDSSADHQNLDLEALEELVRRTLVKAVIPVHFAGLPVDMDRLMTLAATHGFAVVEDCAHAFPVKAGAQFAGTRGDVGVYSFYANKTMTTGEGGMVVTARPELAKRMALMRLHGIDRDAFARYTAKAASWEYDVAAPGYKYNLPDIAAAIGRVQLKKAQGFLEARQALVRQYQSELAGAAFARLPQWYDHHAWHLFVLELNPEALTIDRAAFIQELQGRGIGTSVHFIPLHRLSYYRSRYKLEPAAFPQAERRFAGSVSLPLFPALTAESVSRIAAAILEVGGLHAAT